MFKGLAKEVGLDTVTFETCRGSANFRPRSKEDIEEGTRAGVGGTPAFFTNGKLLTGAQPVAAFTRVIDDELARSTRSAQK
jgi:protein-disulfide isomerase